MDTFLLKGPKHPVIGVIVAANDILRPPCVKRDDEKYKHVFLAKQIYNLL